MRFGVKQQIWSLPAVAIVVFAIGIGVSVQHATRARAHVERVRATEYPLLDFAKTLGMDVERLKSDLDNAVIEGERDKLQQAAKRAEGIRALIGRIGALDGEREHAAVLEREFDAYYVPANKVARALMGMEKGDPQSIAAMQKAIRTLNDDVRGMTERASAGFERSIETTSQEVANTLMVMIVAALAVLLAIVAASFLVVRSIWRQLGGEPEYATRIVRAIAAGDLAEPIALAKNDSRSQLAALATMQASLAALIKDIRNAARNVRGSAGEIAAGMSDLSSRTEEQASSLEETAANMQQLTGTVEDNSRHAQKARDLATGSSEVATRGRAVVHEVVRTMDEIDSASSRMASIVEVIDGIAFQTNILALNAAVEAARAGEEGRGFAVVASEVRALAQRSAASSREIKALIETSAARVADGRRRVSDAGATLDQVVGSIADVASAVAQISKASSEQSAGIVEMGRAVLQIENVTQQNAALVEETSAAAQSMAEQAADLEAAVSAFRLASESMQLPVATRPEGGPAMAALPSPKARQAA